MAKIRPMKNRYFVKTLLMTMLLVFVASCAKDQVFLGNGPPKKEFTRCTHLLSKKKYESAVQCLEMFKAKFPDSEEARLAELRIGDAYFKQKDYLLAAESYEIFLKLYPYSSRAGYAYYRAGLSYSREAPKAIDRDQTYLYNALPNLRRGAIMPGPYQELSAKELTSVRERITARDFYIGKYYYKKDQYVACRPRFVEVTNRVVKGKMVEQSLYYLVRASIGLQELDVAKRYYTILNSRFPDSRWRKKAEEHLISAVRKEEE